MLANPACLTMLLLTFLPADSTQSLEALRLWKSGQQAMLDGQNRKAINCFEESLILDPKMTRNYLSLAAVYLDRCEESKACLYLTLYVAAHPEHVMVRGHYAELLQRLKRLEEAQYQYEHFVSDVQANSNLAKEHLISTHSRLMQIAEQMGTSYEEHLHRGIGLWLLARDHAGKQHWNGQETREALLFRAAGELKLARERRPEEARPCWYLSQVWKQLLQSQPARKYLRTAALKADVSFLTPTERREMHLSLRQLQLRETR